MASDQSGRSAARATVVRAPTRIDFGGGWTDVPPYCDREGGFVCNLAITRHARASVRTASDRRSTRGGPASSDAPLIAAAVRRSGIVNIHVELSTDFPVGAGLGGSSAASAAVLGALDAWKGLQLDRRSIAERGRVIEVEDLGVPGGRQDHYAATFGGALALEFTDRVSVRTIPVSEATRADFEQRALLVYTGESRISGDTITAVLDAYAAHDARVVRALDRMKALAREMASALEKGDIDALAALVGEHWVHQRTLHPAIPTPRIDTIIAEAMRAGALGAKAMGASGGGTVLVIAGRDNREALEAAVSDRGAIVPFACDFDGLRQETAALHV
jgi:D-glycero-alpha-D-manno-heptose-7-phosphate kinase